MLLTDCESYPLDKAWIITMSNHLRDLAKKRFKVSLEDLPEREHRVVQHFGERLHISHDTNLEFEKKLTLGQRLADKVANFGGSWTFIIIFAAILLSWVALNTLILARHSASFDPYPYILLNLFLSMLAVVLRAGVQLGISIDR